MGVVEQAARGIIGGPIGKAAGGAARAEVKIYAAIPEAAVTEAAAFQDAAVATDAI